MRALNETEKMNLRTLEEVLLAYVPPERFCLDGKETNGRMCLEEGGGQWIVFFRDGPLIEDVTTHSTLIKAALQLLRNVASYPGADEQMQSEFLRRTVQ